MKRWSKKGQAISTELAITAVLMIVFCVLGFDMFFVAFGFTRLDAAARDAARAAGSTGNASVSLQAATYACSTYKTDGYFVTQPSVSCTVAVLDPRDQAGVNYLGNGTYPNDFQFVANPSWASAVSGSPYVSVTTRCKIRIPVPIGFFKAELKGNQIAYARTYIFPIL